MEAIDVIRLESFRDVVRLWSSADAMAAELGLPINTTRHWLTRNRVPVKHWPAVIDAVQAKGIHLSAEHCMRFATQN